MPNLADIIVKKNDGTTNITFTGVVPSAGDKSPALWRSTSVGTAPSHQPELRVSSRNNGNNTGRRVDVAFVYPSIVTGTDGRVSVADRVVVNASAIIPLGMTTADSNEAVAQMQGLLASTLMKSILQTGFAPT